MWIHPVGPFVLRCERILTRLALGNVQLAFKKFITYPGQRCARANQAHGDGINTTRRFNHQVERFTYRIQPGHGFIEMLLVCQLAQSSQLIMAIVGQRPSLVPA